MNDRPWASALERLLRERNLKKGVFAEGCGMRAGTISAVINSPEPPKIPTLQRIADGFAAYDKLHPELNLPPVDLWEFFVSDEQSELLRAREISTRAVVDERAIEERIVGRMMERFGAVAREEVRAELRPVAGGANKKR